MQKQFLVPSSESKLNPVDPQNLVSSQTNVISQHHKQIPQYLRQATVMRCLQNNRIVHKQIRVICGKSMYLMISNANDKKQKAKVLDIKYMRVMEGTINELKHFNGSFQGKWEVLKLSQFNYTLTIVMVNKKQQQKYFQYFTTSIKQLNNIKTHLSCQSKIITNSISDITQHRKNVSIQQIIEIQQRVNVKICEGILKQEFQKLIGMSLGDIQSNPNNILTPLLPAKTFTNYIVDTQQQSSLICLPSHLSLSEFCRYFLCCQTNYITNPGPLDQSHPLTSYFCYSSHNTFLSGNQLTSTTQLQRYKQDLQNGVKSVEIDIHWNGDVTHAIGCFGMSNAVNFQTVIKTIYDYHKSIISIGHMHYPIVLSLENHVDTNKREYLVKCLSKYFNNDTYYMEGNEEQFPTLAELMNKIVVKTSTYKSEAKIFALEDEQTGSFSSKNTQKTLPPTLSSRLSYFKSIQPNSKKSSHSFLCFNRPSKLPQKQIKQPMATVTGIFKSHNGIQNTDPCPFEYTSLNSKNVMKIKRKKLIQYSMGSWLRTYPHNWIKSSNYNPAEMLDFGAQFIALNTQTKDINLLALHSYFMFGQKSQNSLCGYRLKPDHLRIPGLSHKQKLTKIKIRVVKNFGFQIKMRFLGIKKDMERNHEKYENDLEIIIQNPQCSFVVIDIGDFLECIPLRYLQTGFRVIIGRNPQSYADQGVRVLLHTSKTLCA